MPDGQDVAYTRYVAIGDSQTEGLWDGNDSGEIVGFADRLAAMLDRIGGSAAEAGVTRRTSAEQ